MSHVLAFAIENAAEIIRPTPEGIQKGLGFRPNTFKTLATPHLR